MATVYLAEVDISKVNYSLLYAYTQVQGTNQGERVRKAEELSAKLESGELDWKTIRHILESQNIPVPPKKVALKLSHEGIAPGRFEDEWKYLICLNHPNVVKVYGGGYAGDRCYYTMELVPGIIDPNEIVEKMTLAERLKIIFMAGKGLSYLHKNGIIHRDIKPDNFITVKNPKGQMITKVTDLGLAKDSESEMGMTASTAVLGTPYFMSPEQMRSAKNVDARADVYSLGASLYEFMTGKKPFHQKSSIMEIMKTALEKELPIPPERHVEDLPKALIGIIKCSMAFDIRDRYPKMEGMLKDIKTYLDTNEAELATSLNFSTDMVLDAKTPSTYMFDTLSKSRLTDEVKEKRSRSNSKGNSTSKKRIRKRIAPDKASKKANNHFPLLLGAGATFALMLGIILFLLVRKPTIRNEKVENKSQHSLDETHSPPFRNEKKSSLNVNANENMTQGQTTKESTSLSINSPSDLKNFLQNTQWSWFNESSPEKNDQTITIINSRMIASWDRNYEVRFISNKTIERGHPHQQKVTFSDDYSTFKGRDSRGNLISGKLLRRTTSAVTDSSNASQQSYPQTQEESDGNNHPLESIIGMKIVAPATYYILHKNNTWNEHYTRDPSKQKRNGIWEYKGDHITLKYDSSRDFANLTSLEDDILTFSVINDKVWKFKVVPFPSTESAPSHAKEGDDVKMSSFASSAQLVLLSDEEISTLSNGENLWSNRKYQILDLPKELDGLKFSKIGGGTRPP